MLMKSTLDVFNRIRDSIKPPRAFSPETLFLLGAFSWVMSMMAEGWERDIIANFGWIFLILGTAWGTSEKPIKIGNTSIGPWITGALVSLYIFGSWTGWDRGIPPIAIVMWPAISSIIAVIPAFVKKGKWITPSVEVRQQLIITVGSNLLISCWLQFHFLVQNWLQEYPTLLSDDFGRSTFVVNLEPASGPKNGITILEGMEPVVRSELVDQPWPQVERWLSEAPQRVPKLSRQIIQTDIASSREEKLWRVEGRVGKASPGYNLQLLAVWSGPSSTPDGYYLSKSCQVSPVGGETTVTSIAEVNCQPTNPTIIPKQPPAHR